MVRFSKDIDLVKWEPILFREMALSSQRLCQGSDGQIDGTTFTSAGASFINSGVKSGHVIYMSNDSENIEGCYEIITVDSATTLTISVIRANTNDNPVAPPAGQNITYHISTFDPQTEEATYGLLQYFNIDLNNTYNKICVDNIADKTTLRQASVFSTLSAVFAANATGKNDTNGLWEKSLRYQKMFYKERSRLRIGIDTDNDQHAEQVLIGGTVRLRRG